MRNLENDCECTENFLPEKHFLDIILTALQEVAFSVASNGTRTFNENCNAAGGYDEEYNRRFHDQLSEKLEQYSFINNFHGSLELLLNGTIEAEEQIIAQYKNEIVVEEGKQVKPIRAFYRVGTTYVSISGVSTRYA